MSLVTFIVSAVLLVPSTAVFATEHADECATTDSYALITTSDQIREAIRCELEDKLEKITHFVSPGYTQSNPACSCAEIFELCPDAPSGYYWIKTYKENCQGCGKLMYCEYSPCNGTVDGGWMRVASIDMTNSSHECPPGLREIIDGSPPRRLCAMDIDDAGCSSAFLPVIGVEYSRVCGKIIGYQRRSPDAFYRFIAGQTTVDTNYVDGISLTHGENPRQHIWTFAAALHEDIIHRPGQQRFLCPCTNTNNPTPTYSPSFVGQDYFCDTGSRDPFEFIFYGDDPLWDGAGCGPNNTCCGLNSPPWFKKELCHPTCDDIEMRLCCDQNRNDEDITFEILEIYVQ